MVEKIAVPVGIFQAYDDGSFHPLTKMSRNAFTFGMGRRIVYALDFVKTGFTPESDTCIIDCIYDGVHIKDPQSQTPMEFITNYISQLDRGLWFGYFEPQQLRSATDPGIHEVTIRVAPRKTAQYFRGRDFSEAAGGVSKTFTFEILPDKDE